MMSNKRVDWYTAAVWSAALFLAGVLAAGSGIPVWAQASNASPSSRYDPSIILVGFKPGVSHSSKASVHAMVGGQKLRSFHLIPVDVVKIPRALTVPAAITAYQRSAHVAYAHPSYRVHAIGVPNDPSFSALWGMDNTGQTGGTPDADIDAPEAWDLNTGSNSVIVGMIDTGIDYNHPDLAANMWTNTAELNGTPGVDDDGNNIVDDIYGANWTSGTGIPTSGDPYDDHYHGTHTSGTVGAVGNDGVGVAGVNWRVRLMGLKFLDYGGSGWIPDAIAALEYAVDHGANLTSNSWGGGTFDQAMQDAIDAAGAANQLFVVAAGNSGTDNDVYPFYPASYTSPNIIAVAASDHDDLPAYFSCFGPTSVDLAAPGVSVYSTWPGNRYEYLDGTSMATPHVAGVAALVLAHAPGSAYADVKQWILDSVDVLPAWSGLTVTGGRLNARRALEYALSSRGVVRFDNEDYGCAATVGIQLMDLDLQGAVAALVPVMTTGGDSESLSVTETFASSAIFLGSIATGSGAVVPGDGILQVSNGATITTTYNDADDGTGNPAVTMDTASIDCVAPQVSNVAFGSIGGNYAYVLFDTNENAASLLDAGPVCGGSDSSASDGSVTSHVVLLTGLAPLTDYFVRIQVTDPAGNVAVDDNGGACYSFTTADQPDYFTELFAASDNDLDNELLMFTPDGSNSFYSVCRTTTTQFPTDPAGGTVLPLGDDTYAQIALAGGAQVSLYGVSYGSLYVGSNGYVTFTSPDSTYVESLSAHFDRPRISALYDDLFPASNVSWKQLADRVAVTWQGVAEYGTANSNSLQIEMFFDGRIGITHLALAAPDGLAGLSAGFGVPADFVESDLTSYAACTPAVLNVTPSDRPVGSAAGATSFDVSNTGEGTMNWSASVISGGDWLTITSGSNGVNDGTIACSFTANTTASQRVGTIRVTAVGAMNSPTDVTVTQAIGAKITVLSPNGGEKWKKGVQYAITWQNQGTVGPNVKIELLRNGVLVQTIAASTPNGGAYNWIVNPALTAAGGYTVRITSTSNASLTDTSNRKFSITK